MNALVGFIRSVPCSMAEQNKNSTTYECHKCFIKKRTTEDLPECNLSKALENGILRRLEKSYNTMAEEKFCNIDEIEKASGLCVRVVSYILKKQIVRDEMRVSIHLELLCFG